MLAPNYTPEAIQKVQANATYDGYRQSLENGPHGAIHAAIDGDMSPPTSPNDPIFFLHHAMVDRLWCLWQQLDLEKRNTEYAGIQTQDQFDGVTPPAASLSDIMAMKGIAEDLAVREYMTTQSTRLCYRYWVRAAETNVKSQAPRWHFKKLTGWSCSSPNVYSWFGAAILSASTLTLDRY